MDNLALMYEINLLKKKEPEYWGKFVSWISERRVSEAGVQDVVLLWKRTRLDYLLDNVDMLIEHVPQNEAPEFKVWMESIMKCLIPLHPVVVSGSSDVAVELAECRRLGMPMEVVFNPSEWNLRAPKLVRIKKKPEDPYDCSSWLNVFAEALSDVLKSSFVHSYTHIVNQLDRFEDQKSYHMETNMSLLETSYYGKRLVVQRPYYFVLQEEDIPVEVFEEFREKLMISVHVVHPSEDIHKETLLTQAFEEISP